MSVFLKKNENHHCILSLGLQSCGWGNLFRGTTKQFHSLISMEGTTMPEMLNSAITSL